MGGAYTAIAQGPQTLFFNPAGIATLPGLQLELGSTIITSHSHYLPLSSQPAAAPATSRQDTMLLPQMALSYQPWPRLGLGLAFSSPYCQSIEWPQSWKGASLLRRFSLQTVLITPTVAFALHPRISVGAGLVVALGSVKLQRLVPSLGTASELALSADDLALSATAGLLVEIVPRLIRFGFSFRGGPRFSLAGDASWNEAQPESDPELHSSKSLLELPLPHIFSFGLSALPWSRLQLALTVDVASWSRLKSLTVSLPSFPEPDQQLTQSWRTTLTVRLGSELRLLPQLPLRLGFIVDQGAAPPAGVSPALPEGRRYVMTLGTGYSVSGFSVDLAYQLAASTAHADSEAALPGDYETWSHLIGLSLGYSHDL